MAFSNPQSHELRRAIRLGEPLITRAQVCSVYDSHVWEMVGDARFELTTFCAQGRRSTRLS